MNLTNNLIHEYYQHFNKQDMHKFLELLHQDIIHDINQGKREIGKEKFAKFMERMNQCYREKISNLIIMSTTDGKNAAAEFIVEGTYLKTDSGLPEAKDQHYSLPGGAFFEIREGKIYRVTNHYNLNDWLKQIGA